MTFDVPADFDAQRLDRFLVSVLGDYSRSQIQKLITDGHVEIRRGGASGRASSSPKPNLLVHESDQVVVVTPEPSESPLASEALPLEILYQDQDLAVLNKPAGMVIHPSAGHVSGTLVNALLHHVTDLSGIGGERRPGIVHRLDRGTSGVMVIAKNDAA
ncbi:MAG TPA: RluA family pseudouridine synthase, partial [Vicinamibacterales bacterium]|nr:RluA family pseudouridine synthase [Vicinamibacterales bacterium]